MRMTVARELMLDDEQSLKRVATISYLILATYGRSRGLGDYVR